jgi:hypothetical protein
MPSITKQGKGYKITVSLGTDGHGNRVRKYLQWLPDPKLTAKQNERALAGDRHALRAEMPQQTDDGRQHAPGGLCRRMARL